jgi:hypothetical protein
MQGLRPVPNRAVRNPCWCLCRSVTPCNCPESSRLYHFCVQPNRESILLGAIDAIIPLSLNRYLAGKSVIRTQSIVTHLFTMNVTYTRVVLVTLSAFAAVLLQGFFNIDGGLAAMKAHAANGMFSNGKVLHRVYLGLPVIDNLLSWSVSFWDPVCHESDSVRLLSTTLSASLQSLGVFAMVEGLRKGKRNIILRW